MIHLDRNKRESEQQLIKWKNLKNTKVNGTYSSESFEHS